MRWCEQKKRFELVTLQQKSDKNLVECFLEPTVLVVDDVRKHLAAKLYLDGWHALNYVVADELHQELTLLVPCNWRIRMV
jgi:hypothetical protein